MDLPSAGIAAGVAVVVEEAASALPLRLSLDALGVTVFLAPEALLSLPRDIS